MLIVMHHSRMKTPERKLILCLSLLTIGLIFMSLGIRWLFFTGLVLLVLSGFLSSRQLTKLGKIVQWVVTICVFGFFAWYYSSGFYQPSWVPLAGVWISGIVVEIKTYGETRSLSHDA